MKMYIFLVSLLLPLFSSAQVKTREAEPPKKEEPVPQNLTPKPPVQQPKEKQPYAYLMLTTDLDINVMVDFEKKYEVLESVGGVKIPVDLSTCVIKVTPMDGGEDGYTLTIELKKGEIRVIDINLDAQRQIIQAQKAAEEDRQRKTAVDERKRIAVAEEQKKKEIATEENNRKRQEEIISSIEIDMVFVQGGRFKMGSRKRDNEKPVHSIMLSDYYIGKYEVTQAQWRAVMGNNPSYFQGCDQCPVERVSWNEVQEFISLLNQKTGKKYRLPTEAEWEYAARGGNMSSGYAYAGSNYPSEVGWYNGNASSKTHPVGQAKPNELGLFDMSGNVWEWCQDWYGTYPSGTQTNPSGPYTGSYRVIRGGCWFNASAALRCTNRDCGSPHGGNNERGGRLAMSVH